ncbi:MAG: class I SAM-dependent methyltransferase [Paludibacter sp.]|nr:class I SAM-dependent methyltransferase [Paludibacter sp.]
MIKSFYKKIFSEKIRLNIRIYLNRFFSFFYMGKNYYCVCCGKSFRIFKTKGYLKRENAECPYCMSLERVRLLSYYLSNELNVEKYAGTKVLHFAPEKCLFDKFKNLDIEYVDADINPAYARHVVDITNIPFDDDYFQLIICSHVLGHIPDERKAINELYRVLKPGGIALILSLVDLNRDKTYENTMYTTKNDRLKHYGEPDLCRLHGIDIKERLTAGGFKVEAIDYRKYFSENEQTKFSLGNGEREIIYSCTK